MLPTIQFLSDEAIYRRTPAGQRALLDPTLRLSRSERRFLAVVTGYTPLRVLLDMDWDDPSVGGAILDLVERGLLELAPGLGHADSASPPRNTRR